MNAEYVYIFDLVNSLKKDNRFLSEDIAKNNLEESLSKGVLVKGTKLDVVSLDYLNPFSKKMGTWYYYKCPICFCKARKIYITEGNRVGCRKCSKIKNRRKVTTSADRVLRIQEYVYEVVKGNVSPKRKKKLIGSIASHYEQLDDVYKLAYNNFVFKSLQDWCLETLRDNNLENPYKEALRDVLKKIKDGRKILVKTGLSSSRNKKYEI